MKNKRENRAPARSELADVAVHYVFQKMISATGELVAVECLSRFRHELMTPEHFFRHASRPQRQHIFLEQLALIERHQSWFLKHHVLATINVDDVMLEFLSHPLITEKVAQIACLQFEVAEDARALMDNAPLPHGAALWLDDFGAGFAGIGALRRHPFQFIKIDKDFFWCLMRKTGGRELMESLIAFLYHNGYKVVIEGIENDAHRRWLRGMAWFAVQGHYWQEVSIEQLILEAREITPGSPGVISYAQR